MKATGNTIVVTGGGSGIGRELSREFHKAGNKVIVAGRRLDALEETIADRTGMTAMTLDLSDASSTEEFARELARDHPDLNVLVNNAGVMMPEHRIDLGVAETTIATNLLGPIRLSSALIPLLAKNERAAIINVSSALAFVPFAATPTYCATKAALHSWSVSLRHQLRNTCIEVIEIIPPAVQTELQPGQSTSPHAMPLDAFIAETMTLLGKQPTPPEICGGWAQPMRSVVDSAKFDGMFAAINM